MQIDCHKLHLLLYTVIVYVLDTDVVCLLCTAVQVHAWVTAMAMKTEALKPWKPLKDHPLASTPKRSSARLRAKRHDSSGLATTAVDEPSHISAHHNASVSTTTDQSVGKQQSKLVSAHTGASGLPESLSSTAQLAHVAQQAASQFRLVDIQAVHAHGSSGPVFHARYSATHLVRKLCC